MYNLYNRLKNAISQPDPTEPAAEPTEDAPAALAATASIEEIIEHLAPEASPLPSPNAGYKPAPVTVADFTVGDEHTAVVTNKSCPHTHMLYISIAGWDGLAVTTVQNKLDWRPGDRMKVKFYRMRPDYTLEFAGPPGPHRNKFGRRNG
jgi:hypothetical protein